MGCHGRTILITKQESLPSPTCRYQQEHVLTVREACRAALYLGPSPACGVDRRVRLVIMPPTRW